MIVNGKLVWYDLSRFASCQIPKAKLCDLMSIPEFQTMVAQAENEISDAWIADAAKRLTNDLRILPEEKSLLDENEIRRRRQMQSRAKNAFRWAVKAGLCHE